jgi:glycoside/pentoside/hexuronide:cation symporter, GPH family
MENKTTKQRPSLLTIWIYAFGQLGWSLAAFGVGSLLTNFYLPPETGATTFPSYLPTVTIMGLTLLGIISFSGRLLDAFTDPFVANMSDKSQNRFGKRKLFMGIAALPLAMFSYLMFVPNTEGVSQANVWWLILTVFLYYISFALYVIPYSALISELGHVKEDRLKISMIISITWALGYVIGGMNFALRSYFEQQGYSPVAAFQTTMGIFAVISAIFMLIPVLFLNENKYAMQGEAQENFSKSLSAVFQNHNFKYFAGMYLLYWLALTFIQMGIIYYVELLLGMDKSMASVFSLVSSLSSFLFYPMMAWFEKKYGKKSTVLTGFIVLIVVFTILLLPLPSIIRFWVIAIMTAFPLATFGILPNIFVADIVHQNEADTGKNQAGMFYAMAAFMMKVGMSLANLIFPSLLILGKSKTNPMGVQISVLAAILFCGLGYMVFKKYEE